MQAEILKSTMLKKPHVFLTPELCTGVLAAKFFNLKL